MMRFAALMFLAIAGASGQTQKAGVDQAGVCSRCHVSSSLEWGISKHSKAGVNCQSCHGESLAHVANEQDAIKPDRRPRGAAIAAFCSTCHNAGCPKTQQTADCQSCHQVHALLDPKQQVSGEQQAKALDAKRDAFRAMLAKADELAAAAKWSAARDAYARVLKEDPASWKAEDGLKSANYRLLNGAIPGFTGEGQDEKTGLPKTILLTGTGIRLVLIDGGDFLMGDDKRPLSAPAHTVHIDTFYLSPAEFTRDGRVVRNISWNEAEAIVAGLNQGLTKGRFRLPTEAEWEYAALSPLLKNMADGVSEWCSTLMLPYPYRSGDGREDLSAPGPRVVRGGNFAEPAEWWSPAARHGVRVDQKLETVGMRLAFSLQ